MLRRQAAGGKTLEDVGVGSTSWSALTRISVCVKEKRVIKICTVNDEGTLVHRWPCLNCRQHQLGLLMQHNEMASSGKKGSSTQLQHAEHSLIWLNAAALISEKRLAYAAAHTASMDKSQFVFECWWLFLFLFLPFFQPWIIARLCCYGSVYQATANVYYGE